MLENRRTIYRPKTSCAILCFINIMSYCDRYLLAAMIPLIKSEFNIDDVRAGLLHASFFMLHVMAAPIYGYMGDRNDRKALLSSAIFLWDLTHFLISFMTNYWLFFVFRMFFGVGHAGFTTVAVPIIGDLFIGRSRLKALAIFQLGVPLGIGLGYMVGKGTPTIFGSWRWSVRLNSLILLVSLVLLMLVLKEPVRGFIEGKVFSPSKLVCDLKYLCYNKTYVLASCAFVCVAFTGQVLSFWGPYVFELGVRIQNKDNNIDVLYIVFGTIFIISGTLGLIFGYMFSMKFRQRIRQIDPIIIAVNLIISIPVLFSSFYYCTYSLLICFSLFFIGFILINMNWPLSIEILMTVILPNKRSLALSIQMIMQHTLGSILGPCIIAILSRYLQEVGMSPQPDWNEFSGLLYACFGSCLIGFLGAILLFVCSCFLIKDAIKMEQWGRQDTPEQTFS